jgi:hypothetical protein
MADWLYRATISGTSFDTTADLLDEGAAWRSVFRSTGSANNNVTDVTVGDRLHIYYSHGQGRYDFAGSFVVTDVPPEPGATPVVSEGVRSSIWQLPASGALAKRLEGAAYVPDPKLRAYCVFSLEPCEPVEHVDVATVLKTLGNAALFRLDLATDEILTKKGRRVLLTRAGTFGNESVAASTNSVPTPTSEDSAETAESPGRRTSRLRAVGLDWSGSQTAGKKIWQALLEASDTMELVALDRPFCRTPSPGDVLSHFPGWFSSLSDVKVVGMDFCFGLSAPHTAALLARAGIPTTNTDARNVGAAVSKLFGTAEAFELAVAPEAKRTTDRLYNAPFAPTNLRMFRQTYLGLRCLATLPEGTAIFPWASAVPESAPLVVEVLPALLARTLGPGLGYKGRSAVARSARLTIVAELRRRGMAISSGFEKEIASDIEGDALDAVLAALAAVLALGGGLAIPKACASAAAVEGWIVTSLLPASLGATSSRRAIP